MIILTEAPPNDAGLTSLYARLPMEGMVHSSMMCGESYDPSSSYDDAWSCPAVTWSSGGRETYLFENGDIFELQNTGIMTIAAGDRYAYSAEAVGPVTLCRFSRRKLEALLERFPQLERRLLGMASNELAAAQEQMLLLGRKTAREKIASSHLRSTSRAASSQQSSTACRLTSGHRW